jgi:hypothetical protein
MLRLSVLDLGVPRVHENNSFASEGKNICTLHHESYASDTESRKDATDAFVFLENLSTP